MKFNKRLFVILVSIQTVLAITICIFVYLQMRLISTLGEDYNNGSLAVEAALALALLIFLDLVEAYVRGSLYADFSVQMKTEVSRAFMVQSPQSHNEKSSEEHISFFTNELETILNQYYYFVLYRFKLLLQFAAGFVTLLAISWQCGLAVTAAAVSFALIIKLASSKLAAKQKKLQDKKAVFVDTIAELHSGYEEIHINQMESLAEEDFFISNLALEQAQCDYRLSQYGVETLSVGQNILVYMIILSVGGVLAYNGLTGLGVFVSAAGLSVQLLNYWSLLSRIKVKMKGVEPLKKEFDTYLNTLVPEETFHEYGEVLLEVNNLSYSYEPDASLLENVNLVIVKGKKYLITGESGCGKSTLLDILAGHKDCQIGEINRYTKKIAYIPQEPFLFKGTLRQNIVFNQEINDDELYSLLYKLGLDLSLNLIVEEAGSNLSGGQKSRVALARALLTAPDLLITDELTANLDIELGSQIEEMLLTEYPEMALCSVAHRTYCFEKYDAQWTLFSELREEEVKNVDF